jgi:AcrR family transcriptional regulator
MNAPQLILHKDIGDSSKEEILRAAAEVFMEFGYAATSIDAVAERLGATKGRVYHHYPSKADLFFEVQIAAMTRLNEEVEPLARMAGTPVERLFAMALRHTQVLLNELPMQKVAVQGLERYLLGKSPTVKRLRSVVKMRDDYENMFAEVIDEGIRQGLFVDLPTKLATKPFFGALNWATIWYTQRRFQNAQGVDDIAQTLAAFAMRGLLKDPTHDASFQAPPLSDNLG